MGSSSIDGVEVEVLKDAEGVLVLLYHTTLHYTTAAHYYTLGLYCALCPYFLTTVLLFFYFAAFPWSVCLVPYVPFCSVLLTAVLPLVLPTTNSVTAVLGCAGLVLSI